MKCLNLEGINLFEAKVLDRATHHDMNLGLEFIERYSPKLRQQYCLLKCPKKQLCDFYRRYPEYERRNN